MHGEQQSVEPGAPLWPAPLADAELASPKRTRGIVIALVLVAALVAGAISVVALTGSSSSHKAAALVLRDAPGVTTGSGTAKLSMVAHLDMGSRSTDFLRMEGASDFRDKTTQVTMHIGPVDEEMRTVDGTTYLRASVLPLTDGKHWISISAADLGSAQQDIAKTVGNNDPSSGLQYLSAITGTPTEVGHETIDGVDTTHYTFTLDLDTLLQKLADSTSKDLHSDALRQSLQTLHGLVDLQHLAGQAWIDEQGRVRRFDYAMNIRADGQSVNETFDIHFFDFGAPVTVTAPPADDVVPFRDVPDYFKQLQRAASTLRTSA